MNKAQVLKNIWSDVYDPKKDIKDVIKEHFHQEYKQCINGVVMNRSDYTQHVVEQRQNMNITNIEYAHMIEDGDELFAIYQPKGKNLDGEPIEAEVIAYFRFKGEQVISIKGLVRLITGDVSDVDMDSHYAIQ